MNALDEFKAEWERMYRCVCAFGIGDMDPEPRGEALKALNEVMNSVLCGFNRRRAEAEREEERRIVRAYRAGRLVEQPQPQPPTPQGPVM
jgi:hypothetical protein